MAKRALITGISGQDGSFLAELLLEKGYKVYGLRRRTSTSILSLRRVQHLLEDIELLDGDLSDYGSLVEALYESKPDEVYNLAAQSFVKTSFVQPELTGNITGMGVTRLLEAVFQNCKNARFYQASSSEIFGNTPPPQRENTVFYPRSPYGCAKLYAYWMTRNYRERPKDSKLFTCNGILFNHESPRRGPEFVTQKIAQSVASIKLGLSKELRLGNMEAQRDWGHAKDYVRAMWMMLQHDVADDYVVGTGEAHSVKEFVECAFKRVNLDWQDYVVIDQAFFRPTEVDYLLADPTKINTVLGWKPEISFEDLVNEMVDNAVENPEEWQKKQSQVTS